MEHQALVAPETKKLKLVLKETIERPASSAEHGSFIDWSAQ